ncbi:MAG: TusE/DsrC/DsvC family sulfur relay protein [Gammaproteobacteria bacterium]|nr:TusE/DsrC/DsvC family sulfur relay protein [Gammaproteobacteria bacterium]
MRNSAMLIFDGKEFATDEEGFLMDPFVWNEGLGRRIAELEKLELTEHRWDIVMFVREHFDHNGTVPEARVILKEMAARYGKDKATRRYLYELFPYGYGQQACKIAGMRKPRKLMLDV